MSQEVRHPQFDLLKAATLLQTVSLESWEYSATIEAEIEAR